MPVDEYSLILGHFLLEKRRAEREQAQQRAQQSVRSRRR